MVAPRYRAHGL